MLRYLYKADLFAPKITDPQQIEKLNIHSASVTNDYLIGQHTSPASLEVRIRKAAMPFNMIMTDSYTDEQMTVAQVQLGAA